MDKITLPNSDSKTDNDNANTKVTEDKKTALDKQIEVLSEQLKQLTEDKKKSQTANDIVKAAKEKKVEEKRQEQLSIDADLKTLLAKPSTDGVDKDTSKVNDLTNLELVNVMANAVSTTLDARLEQLQDKVGDNIDTTNDNIRQLSKIVGQMLASQGVEKVRSDHTDFDIYKKEIAVILNKYPNMQIDDAYYMAKGVKVGDSPKPSETDMEKADDMHSNRFSLDIAKTANTTREDPTMSRSKPKDKTQTTNADPTHGILSFRNAVAAAADKVVNERM